MGEINRDSATHVGLDEKLILWLREDITDLRKTLTVTTTEIKAFRTEISEMHRRLSSVEQKERPCPDFIRHISEHDTTEGRWWRVALNVLTAALVAAATAFFTLFHSAGK